MPQKTLLSKYPKFEVVAEPGMSSWRLNSASRFLERDWNILRSRRIGLEKKLLWRGEGLQDLQDLQGLTLRDTDTTRYGSNTPFLYDKVGKGSKIFRKQQKAF